MATSAKKKLDEYHLKILRQLLTLPANKECFDCHQRGPTYVNVTIGSFVCTTCSGMLRGLTPPHRVKSISMATFTPDEIEFVKARGNDYCRKTWLGLLDSSPPTKDEQQIKDFMIAKYERKRYYLDPAVASTINKTVNGSTLSPGKQSTPSEPPTVKPTKSLAHSSVTVQAPPPATAVTFKTSIPQIKSNSSSNAFTPEPFADFNNLSIPPPTDPFNSSQSAAAPVQSSFANFDNNPVFSNSGSNASLHIWTEMSPFFPPFFKVPLRPMSGRSSCPPSNRWSIPGVGESGSAPGEDRYAALKDLDCLMKSQKEQAQVQEPAVAPSPDWTPGVTNGMSSVWSAPSLFPTPTNQPVESISNPFKVDGVWNSLNNNTGANPFRNNRPLDGVWPSGNSNQATNGFTSSQSINFPPSKAFPTADVISNPFMKGAGMQMSGHHSSNPFL